ncbi:MAG: hypothetical protein Q6364_10850 [Candidatus Hermodarchaeota archaeon]|jgi:hypothetical protein|nr:hypothetical protein [Candidatus Hermodarchaeota archaeon]
MSTSTELDAIALKVQQAYYEDGLADLFMGVIFLGLASVFTMLAYNITFLVFMLIMLNPLFYDPLIEAAKRRWVYPRAGYVKPKPFKETSTRGVLLILVLIASIVILPPVVLFIISGYAGLFFWLIWIAPVGFGLLIAIGLFFLAHRYHLTRYYLFAILLPVIGVIVPWLNLSVPNAYAAFFTTFAIQNAIIGLLALFSGTVLFLRFLHRYHVEPTDPAEGENPHARV